MRIPGDGRSSKTTDRWAIAVTAQLPSKTDNLNLWPMTITLEIPEQAEAALRGAWSDLPRAALESMAVEGYRMGKLSCAEVGRMLCHSARWESEDFLSAHGAWPGTTVEELESDLRTIERLKRA